MTDQQPEQTPEETPVDVTVGAGDDARTVPVTTDQVFIYAPGVQNTNDPAMQAAMQRAANLVRREVQRAERRSMSPGDWMRAQRERETRPTPEETLVVVPTEPTPDTA